MSQGVLARDVVEFGPGLTIGDLALGISDTSVDPEEQPDLADRPWYYGGTLSIRWGSAGVDIEIPDVNFGFEGDTLPTTGDFEDFVHDYEIGRGIDEFRFADGSTYTMEQMLRFAFDQTAITGTPDDDVLEGCAGAERIIGLDGDDHLSGGGGNDTLGGGAGSDMLEGGTGDDGLYGGAGDDVYIYNHGDGNDVVYDYDEQEGNTDTIRFGAGIAPADVVMSRSGNNLVARVIGSGTVTVQGYFTDTAKIERFEFAGGAVRSSESIVFGSSQSDYLSTGEGVSVYAGDGNDTIYAFGGDNAIFAGAGDDYAVGGEGDDSYVFEAGGGRDEYFDSGGFDTLSFGDGITPEDVYVTEAPWGTLVAGIRGTTDRVMLDAWSNEDFKIEQFRFADGTTWNAAEIGGHIGIPPATEFSDLLYLTDGDDVVDALGGDDEVYGFGGNDILQGGAGNDSLSAGSGHNLLIGDAGNDFFSGGESENERDLYIGGAGNDRIFADAEGSVILHNAGDGEDLVNAGGGQALTLSIGGATTADVTLSVLYNPEQDSVVVRIGLGESSAIDTYAYFNDPESWPAGKLQIVGTDVRTYDLNAVMQAFFAAREQDEGLTVWSAEQALQDNLLTVSTTEAIGGDIAYRYATTGSIASLSTSQRQAIMGSDDFALAPQALSAGNSAPMLDHAVSDQTANEDAAFSFSIPADTFSDPDAGDTLLYSASLDNGNSLPGWLSFDAETRTFSGTPHQADVGAIDVKVTATDGSLSASDTFQLNVANVNDRPVVTADDSTLILGTSVAATTLFSVFDEDDDTPAQYEFWDSTAGNGHFSVNGIEADANTSIPVSASDLANTTFTASDAISTDQVWVRANDGQAWSDWKSWTVQSSPHATNALPTVTASDGEILIGDSAAAAGLFSVGDADDDAITQYEFWDNVEGGGYFAVNGVQQDASQTIAVSAADLANTEYVAGSGPGTEQVFVRASDGIGWSSWKSWNITSALHPQDAAPEITATATQTVLLNQDVTASVLFSASDADGDSIAQYEFWDSTAGNGHFAVSGVEQNVNTAIYVDGDNLGDVSFVGGSATGSDQVWARASDGQVWGEWKSWTMNSWTHATNSAPVATATDATVVTQEVVDAASLFDVTDGDGDSISKYEFWDDVNGGGYFRVNGVQQAASQTISVSASDLANTEYVGGANPGTEQVWVRANDGMEWGAWKPWEMTTALHVPNAAPVVSAADTTVLLNHTVAAADMFSVSDADEDSITQYEFWDSTAGNGHFEVNGVAQGANASIAVSAADLADTQFLAGSSTGTDQVWVRANDGQTWSDWKSWNVNSWPHLTNASPVVTASAYGLLKNETVAAADLFSVSDANDDAMAKYEFWDDVNGGGHFELNGVQQAAGQAIAVDAADLANTTYIGGSNAGTEQVWVRANDGMEWGAWKNWNMSTEGGMLRGGAGPDTLNGDPDTPVLQGGGGDDTLNAGSENSVLSGNDGADTLNGGDGDDLLAGGAGDDQIETGAGHNVVAFNKGDGADTVGSAVGASNSVSLGNGISYNDLSLSKDGNDLVLNTGDGDSVRLKDWYESGKDTVDKLQMVLDATNGYDANSSDPLYNKKVETFDFRGIVSQFDQAMASSPGLTSWAVTNALLQYHLSGSDDAAMGGDLAYWYGKNGGFTGISLAAAQQVIGAPGFGSDAQSLHAFSGLQEGLVKLA